MKYLLLIIAMVIGSYCWGQHHTGKWQPIIDSGFTPKQDTVRCLMLVCDTSRRFYIDEYFKADSVQNPNSIFLIGKFVSDTVFRLPDYSIQWQFGYGILKPPYRVTYNHLGERIDFEFREYLDQNKKPLPKSIVVWMTKEIK